MPNQHTIRCACCGQPGPYGARGLRGTCYVRHHAAGTHIDYPRRNRSPADFADDYATCRTQGLTRRQMADRMHLTMRSIVRNYSACVAAGLLEPDSPAYRAHITATTRPGHRKAAA